MENRIDIKLFRTESKFKFIKDIFVKQGDTLEGKELEFYNLDKEGISSLEGKSQGDNTEFLYNIIPVLSNVDITINKDEFIKMCKVPSGAFAEYIDLLLEHITNMFKTAVKLSNVEEKVNNFIAENNIPIPESEPIKVRTRNDVEKEIQDAYNQLKTDKEHRVEILYTIDYLEDELKKFEDGGTKEEVVPIE